jgi:hypothetical protein
MGYTTNFEGEFTIEPALTKEQAAYLTRFSETRRMKRDADIADNIRDPLREAVGLPVGEDGAYFVNGRGFMGQDKDESVLDGDREPDSQPGLWCQWEPNEDGTKLRWNDAEKFYSYVEWLEYIDVNFLKPWGRKLTGAVSWQGEDDSDYGLLTAGEVGVHALPGVRATDKLESSY